MIGVKMNRKSLTMESTVKEDSETVIFESRTIAINAFGTELR